METASIFTATDALRPLHEHQLASDHKPHSRRSPIPGDDQDKQHPTTLPHWNRLSTVIGAQIRCAGVLNPR
jgi:hypothetical protein